ncbi:MAG TPA: response regulator, partial [Gammaproteobacteria bacterium]|nr:response regulator [Gammaproteobacteria bacterium]
SLSKYLQLENQDIWDFSVRVQLSQLHQEIFNPHRFEETCILIVDYDMPSMNGLELARNIKSQLPIKIIMLTGEADQETAITAFNQKEIHQFLSKSATDYPAKLVKYIQQLQREYYLEVSKPILDCLSTETLHPLRSKALIGLFQTICSKYQIIEYYLAEESGSFLMLDTEGKETWLIIRTAADMETFYELASGEPDIPQQTLHALHDKTKLVFFPKHDEFVPPQEDWVIHDAIRLDESDIYYCLLPGKDKYHLQPTSIVSYKMFLDTE